MNVTKQAVELFEKMAINADCRISIEDLLEGQSEKIKQAIMSNNHDALKAELGGSEYTADTCKVVAA